MGVMVRKANTYEYEYMKREEVWESDVTTFDYCYENEETFLLEKGKGRITYDGKTVCFEAGDICVASKGLCCHWEVLEPIKKYLH